MPEPTEVEAPFWEDCLEIFYQPSAVFRRRQEDGFGLALLVLVVVMAILYFATRSAMAPVFDAEFNRAMAAAARNDPRITPETIEQSRGVMRQFAGVWVIGFFILGPLLVGLVLWMAGKLVEAKEEAGTAIMVAVYAFYPRIVEGVLNALQALLLPEGQLTSRYSVTLGVGRLLNPDTASPLLLALVGRIDVFTLWVTALLAIGLSVTGKVARRPAAALAGLVWLIGALPGVIGALRQT